MDGEAVDAAGDFAWCGCVAGRSALDFGNRGFDGGKGCPVPRARDGDVVVLRGGEEFRTRGEMELGYGTGVVH